MHESAFALIDLAAIEHNLTWTQNYLKTHSAKTNRPFIWSVVKGDAYGHGLSLVLPAMKQADGLAVLGLHQVLQCRKLGWDQPVLAMRSTFTANDLADPGLGPLHLVVDNEEQLAVLSALQRPGALHVWLRHAGTLNHTGLQHEAFSKGMQMLQGMANNGTIASVRPFLHPAQAQNKATFETELRALLRADPHAMNNGCTMNSAALLSAPEIATKSGWVRSGIVLYGVSPLPGKTGTELGLKPAMTLKAPVYGIQTLQAGQAIGYGSGFVAENPMRIGLVSCGYADGYPRHAAPGTPVRVHNKPATLVGTVSMDLLTIDLTHLPDVQAGSWVTLWGDGLPVEQVAACAGTIAADLLTSLTPQVQRQARPS